MYRVINNVGNKSTEPFLMTAFLNGTVCKLNFTEAAVNVVKWGCVFAGALSMRGWQHPAVFMCLSDACSQSRDRSVASGTLV